MLFRSTPAYGPRIMERYRRGFVPSSTCSSPQGAVAVSVVCAAADEEAEALATSQAVWRLRPEGERGPVPSPQEASAAARDLDPVTRARMAQDRGRVVVGEPGRVRDEVLSMAEDLDVDEVLVVTVCHDQAARRRSYELLAGAFELEAPPG